MQLQCIVITYSSIRVIEYSYKHRLFYAKDCDYPTTTNENKDNHIENNNNNDDNNAEIKTENAAEQMNQVRPLTGISSMDMDRYENS